MGGAAAKAAIDSKRKQTTTGLETSRKKVEDLKAPVASGLTIPQTALGLLLAAFDHSGRAAEGYMQGLQMGRQQEFQGRQTAFDNQQRKLAGEIDRQERWLKILNGQSEYGG